MGWKQIKHKVYVAVTALMLGITAFGSIDASAATIKTEPQETSKQTIGVGGTVSQYNITNLKINGKKYSKYKKKVKTVQTKYDPTYIRNDANGTRYVNSEFVPDTEDYEQQWDQNYKYISAGSYEFTFLKPGTYKISYDKYERGETKRTPSADGKSETVVYELIKTHYVDTYKVVTTTNPIKSITLGKNKITNTYKSSGTKTNVKTVTKFRYLKGKSGKLSFKANKNYKITSAFAVTYNANGDVVVSPSGNGKKVTYGTGKATSKTEREQYVLDANGNYTYVKDAAGNDTDERQSQMVTTATSTSKYKPTTIYYGYRDTFTGSYTNYSVSTRQVYVRRKDEKKHDIYQKNPDGTYVRDANGNRQYVTDAVMATVITRTYPERTIMDGAYKTVAVVEEKVVLPGAKSINEGKTYYMDASCRSIGYSSGYVSGEYVTVSKGGVNRYDTVTLEDGRVARYINPVYTRRFYDADYQGSWQPIPDGDNSPYEKKYCDRTIDPKTGEIIYTTRYKWVETYDAEGKRKEVKDYNKVTTTHLDGTQTFNMK